MPTTASAGDRRPYVSYGAMCRVSGPIYKSDGTKITSGTASSLVSTDQGTHGAGATPVQVATNSGEWYVDLTATNCTGSSVSVWITTDATGAVPALLTFPIIRRKALLTGTARTAGSPTTSQVQLATSAPSVDGALVNMDIFLDGGTGIGQIRRIVGYTGSTRMADLDAALGTATSTDTTYQILPTAEAPHIQNDSSGTPIVKPQDGSIVTATFGTCVPPAPTGMSTLTQTQVTGGAYDLTHWFGAKGGLPILDSSSGTTIIGYGAAQVQVTVPDGQKVDVNTVKGRAVTDVGIGNTVYLGTVAWSTLAVGAKMDIVDAPNATAVTAIQNGLSKPGTAQTITPPADMALNSTVAKAATALSNATWTDAKAAFLDQAVSTKRAVTLATADVSGNLPANAVQWNGGTLPAIGTSTLTAQNVWEYATRVLTANTNLGLPTSWPASWPASWNWTVASDLSGLATITALAAAVTAIESYGDVHWTAPSAAANATAAATAILATPTNKLATDSSGRVTSTNAGASASEIDTQLSGTHGSGLWGSVSGGTYTQTVRVVDGDGNQIPNARVDIISGGVLVDTKQTNASGVASPSCNSGDYTLRVTAAGYQSSTQAMPVSGADSWDVTLSQITISPSPLGTLTAYWICYGADGTPEEGVTHYLQVRTGDGTAGESLYGGERSAVSGSNGLVQFVGVPHGAGVRRKRGANGQWSEAIAPATGDTWAMDQIVGNP